MTNEYIQELILLTEKNIQEAEKHFSSLDSIKLNFKPDEKSWSIGQVFDHLLTSNELYFPIFKSILEGSKKKTFWERVPLLPRLFGSMLVNSLKEGATGKAKAPKAFHPSTSAISADIVSKFIAQQHRLIAAMQENYGRDHSRIMVTSPAAGFIAYNLRDCFKILTYHSQRHLRQAHRILSLKEIQA